MPDTPTPAANVSVDDARAAYQTLFDALGDAYWAASTVQAKDEIQGTRDTVHAVLTGIIQAQLDENTKELEALTPQITKTNDALDKLQTSIGNIVKRIEVVGKVEDAITGVLQIAGKFL